MVDIVTLIDEQEFISRLENCQPLPNGKHVAMHNAATLIKAYRDLTAELRARIAELERDAKRYRVLRAYRVSGSWPMESGAPAGILVFSSSEDETAFTQCKLDHLLDDMLGLIPSADNRVREDYQEWRATETEAAIVRATLNQQNGKD